MRIPEDRVNCWGFTRKFRAAIRFKFKSTRETFIWIVNPNKLLKLNERLLPLPKTYGRALVNGCCGWQCFLCGNEHFPPPFTWNHFNSFCRRRKYFFPSIYQNCFHSYTTTATTAVTSTLNTVIEMHVGNFSNEFSIRSCNTLNTRTHPTHMSPPAIQICCPR